ncbi:hypothetical protein EV193_108167 [Herbihabitans rhizosphaerae]|uniref:DUF3558 family protein n=2 Tax=Herbihabitans rhizosphaerae TaxID=1872711 RepID=A0A4Q7KIQ7_9PSEU|nr:hypothetical protein EV193_108167 [Herbihabitans rhizosphaerae]
MHWISRPYPRLAIAAAALAVGTVAACTSTVAGQPSAAGGALSSGNAPTTGSAPQTPVKPVAKLPFKAAETEAAYVRVMRPLQQWDLCAIHDVQAAERATAAKARFVRPGALNECELSVDTPDGKTSFSVNVEVSYEATEHSAAEFGRPGPKAPRYQKGDINGVVLYKELPRPAHFPKLPEFGTSCHFLFPIEYPLGAKVEVHSASNVMPSRDAMCGMADTYITALLPTLQKPPLIANSATTPQISLYGKDACVSMEPVFSAPGSGAGTTKFLTIEHLYKCGFGDGYGSPAVEFTTERTDMFEGKEPIQFGAIRGFVERRSRECNYFAPVDQPFSIDAKLAPFTAVIRFEPGNCDDELARKVVAATVDQPVAPRGGTTGKPVKLGALGR